MTAPGGAKAAKVTQERRADGSILLRSAAPPGPVADTTAAWLRKWSAAAGARVFLAERSGAGWREERYAPCLQKVRAIAAALLGRGFGAGTPILIMSGNGIDHGLLALGAQYAGVPVVPVAEQYSLIPGAHGRLQQIIAQIGPKLAYVDDAGRYAEALSLDALAGVEIVASRPGAAPVTGFDQLLRGDGGVDLAAAHARTGPDTVAKILMTSGSTTSPKGVLTTQRMMCANQAQIADALPFLRARAPCIVDWLPWNHVFGGSHNFNMMLANGGSLYIDDGKPVSGAFARTLENLSMVSATASFNVPAGFAMLLDALSSDGALSRRFFADLDLIFSAGAALPHDVGQGFAQMAREVRDRMPLITSGWGLTETAPAAMIASRKSDGPANVGVPLCGVTVKLIPDGDMRCEVRLKGPNVMPGYFNAPARTRQSFDDEGFFITGDAMTFADPDHPEAGMRFAGRISEDFKLSTGTWVRASALRLEMLACLAPLAADLVITGHDRRDIGVLIFPDRTTLARLAPEPREEGGVLCCAPLGAEVARRLSAHATQATGSSMRVGRAMVLAAPASIAGGEITAKGNLNFARVLSRRADILARLYDDADPALIKI